ncbi:MAG: nitrate reductase cytochrome c-type subunit [Rhodospirillales bacterium]|nr:nitrate reductase cytochrome c-type subunit [Rhodospirillales bacterium]
MKKFILATAALFMVVALALPQIAQAGSMSLRGDKELSAASTNPDIPKLQLDQESFKRNFKEQPPLIPHKVKKYQINLKNNRCLSCHDKDNYKEEEAPLTGKSHYMTKDGKEGKTINMSRYFCTQCHVGQTVAKPLVENVFKGVPVK